MRSKRERSGCKPSITPFTTMLCTVYAASGLAFSLLTRLAGVLVTAVALRLLLFTDALDLNALFSRELVIAVNFDDVRLFICDRKNTVLYNCHSECRRLNRLHALSLDVSNVDNWDDSGSPARCRVVVCYLAWLCAFLRCIVRRWLHSSRVDRGNCGRCRSTTCHLLPAIGTCSTCCARSTPV